MIALVRPISDSFDQAITRVPGPRPQVARARTQHAAYVEALASLVDEVLWVPADDDKPDACFIEDMAVVARGRALLGRSGAVSRRGEQEAVASALPRHLERHELPDGATLDGGDVLIVGDRVYVGLSARTNAAAADALAACFEPVGLEVVPVQVRDALHLKCHCTSPGRDVVLLAEGFADPGLFAGCEVVLVPAAEAWGANVVGVGGKVLVAEGFPSVIRALKRRGFDPIPIAVDEIAKADGSLTCLSILVA